MVIFAIALVTAACSSSSKSGSASLPSIPAVSTTAAAPSDTPSSPSEAPSTQASSTKPTITPSASVSATSSPSTSTSPSPSAQAGGGCLTSQLTLSLGESQGAAGSQIAPLIFTNSGSASCTLGGYPGVSFVTGDNGSQVGAAGVRSGAAGGTINLAPKQTAQALVKIADTDNYPPTTCRPVTVRGLRVYPPGQKAALFVALPDAPEACSGSGVSSQLSVQTVTAAD